ncbi:MAG: hypothetical protein GY795_50955 [Desulfobacterales bacterium]|nr:hypothetical protein [Desulfobacterales bacterium]
MSEFERLFKERERLQQELSLLNEKLAHLGKSCAVTDAFSSKGFELTKEKDATEDRYDEIDRRLNNIEQKIKKLNICKVFDYLLNLDCNEHVERFIEFITAPPQAGAFFLHGAGKYSLRFLLKRLLQEISYCSTDQPIVINLPSIFRRYGWDNDFAFADLLWHELGSRIGLRREPSRKQITERLSQKRKTQNIILVLDQLDSRYDLDIIIENFWFDLADNTEEALNYFLMAVLVDDFDYLNGCERDFFETHNNEWTHRIPVKLPVISNFASEDLEIWIKQRARGIFDPGIKCRADQIVEEIIENCNDGCPDSVIEYICTRVCQCKFDEGVLKEWLKL